LEHLDANTVAAFAAQTLTAKERSSVIGHLAECADCREWIAVHAQLSNRVARRPIWVPLTATAAAGIAGVLMTIWLMRPPTAEQPSAKQPVVVESAAGVTEPLPAWKQVKLAPVIRPVRPANQASVITTVGEKWIPVDILHRRQQVRSFGHLLPVMETGQKAYSTRSILP